MRGPTKSAAMLSANTRKRIREVRLETRYEWSGDWSWRDFKYQLQDAYNTRHFDAPKVRELLEWRVRQMNGTKTRIAEIRRLTFARAGVFVGYCGYESSVSKRETGLRVTAKDLQFRRRLWEKETGMTLAGLERIIEDADDDFEALCEELKALDKFDIQPEDYWAVFADGDDRRRDPNIPGRIYYLYTTQQTGPDSLCELDEERDLIFVHHATIRREKGVAFANEMLSKTEERRRLHASVLSRSPAVKATGTPPSQEQSCSPNAEDPVANEGTVHPDVRFLDQYVNDEEAPEVEDQYDSGRRNRDGTKNW